VRSGAEHHKRSGADTHHPQGSGRDPVSACSPIQERRREGQKNLPNIVRVVSREWLAWLRLARALWLRVRRAGALRETCKQGEKNTPHG